MKIAVTSLRRGKAGTANKSFKGHFVETLISLAGEGAKRRIQIIRYVLNRIPHANSVWSKRKECKQIWTKNIPFAH